MVGQELYNDCTYITLHAKIKDSASIMGFSRRDYEFMPLLCQHNMKIAIGRRQMKTWIGRSPPTSHHCRATDLEGTQPKVREGPGRKGW